MGLTISCFAHIFFSVLTMKRILLLTSLTAFLSACSSVSDLIPTSISTSDRGDSAPSEQRDISQIADAQPQPVIRTRAGNKSPYTVLGKTYTLLSSSEGYQEQGGASWYGTKFHGRRTANGEVYDMWGMTAAHKTLPIPSYVRVTNLANGRSVVVLVNDRGPFHSERIIDLSYAAALKLGFAQQGVATVEVVDVTPLEQSAVVPRAVSSPVSPVNKAPVVVPVAPPLAPAASAPTSASVEGFQPVYFQAGAFRSLDSANKLQKKLQSSAIRAPVVVAPNQDSSWYRVRVGPLTSAQRVSETKQLLYEQGVKKPQLVKSP